MKNNIGITVASIGMLFSVFASNFFEGSTLLWISGFGVVLAIYGAFKADSERKLKPKN